MTRPIRKELPYLGNTICEADLYGWGIVEISSHGSENGKAYYGISIDDDIDDLYKGGTFDFEVAVSYIGGRYILEPWNGLEIPYDDESSLIRDIKGLAEQQWEMGLIMNKSIKKNESRRMDGQYQIIVTEADGIQYVFDSYDSYIDAESVDKDSVYDIYMSENPDAVIVDISVMRDTDMSFNDMIKHQRMKNKSIRKDVPTPSRYAIDIDWGETVFKGDTLDEVIRAFAKYADSIIYDEYRKWTPEQDSYLYSEFIGVNTLIIVEEMIDRAYDELMESIADEYAMSGAGKYSADVTSGISAEIFGYVTLDLTFN